jgi:hypothetical protein
MKDIFARCLKRADVQVCTFSCVILIYNANPSLATYVPYLLRSTIAVLLHVRVFVTVLQQVFIFRRLKVNHESQEFILDSGTVANTKLALIWLGSSFDYRNLPSNCPRK